jgi:ubiquinone/menaquinone biosynthesis C-methylase UbiE
VSERGTEPMRDGEPGRIKVIGIAILSKALGIIVVLALLRELQIQFGIGVAMLALLHVVAAAAVVKYMLRGRLGHVGVSQGHDVTSLADRNPTTGVVLHRATRYDLLVWLLTLGRERAVREKVLRLARLAAGEAVLDVGCGTGTLAIAAKRHVGPAGLVYGIDASPEMISRADKKARKAGAEVVFKNGLAQALPFADAQFDAVLSTMMLHHLPPKARQQCAFEMRRVLKPGGRVLAVDFGRPARPRRNLFAHFRRHGHVDMREITALLNEAGLDCVGSGAVGIGNLQFVLATGSRGTCF